MLKCVSTRKKKTERKIVTVKKISFFRKEKSQLSCQKLPQKLPQMLQKVRRKMRSTLIRKDRVSQLFSSADYIGPLLVSIRPNIQVKNINSLLINWPLRVECGPRTVC